jgi:hypothetical protein
MSFFFSKNEKSADIKRENSKWFSCNFIKRKNRHNGSYYGETFDNASLDTCSKTADGCG